MERLSELFTQADQLPKSRLILVAAQEKASLEAALEAYHRGWVDLTLVGEEEKIRSLLEEKQTSPDGIRLIHADSLEEAASLSVEEIRKGEADILLKGLIDTSILLKALLSKEAGLKNAPLLSHLMLYEVPGFGRLIGLTDGGMNLAPDLEKKRQILRNALGAMEKLGYESVKVALLAAKEKASPSMPATVDAAELAAEYENERHIVEGPLALDLALSREAAEIKGFPSRVAGETDLLLVSAIEVGNVLGKAFTYLAHAHSAGVIIGAQIPVLVVSRADSAESKLYSIALGKVLASRERRSH